MSLALAIEKTDRCRTVSGLGNNRKPESAAVHCRIQGKVMTDATLERQVSMSPSLVSSSSKFRIRFLPIFHCAESCSSEYCA